MNMNKALVSIATITLARNTDEERLLKKSLSALAQLAIPIYLTDGGSSVEFVQFLATLPNVIVLPTQKGLWLQAKSGLEAAAKTTPFVFYTEPDKLALFTHHLARFFQEIEIKENTGVYLLSRSKKAFESFPPFQQMTETTINKCCAEVIGEDYEYTYGPFLINSKIIEHLKNIEHNIGWGWRPYAFAAAKKLGFDIHSYVGDFFCPADQHKNDNEESRYRMRQLIQNITGLTSVE